MKKLTCAYLYADGHAVLVYEKNDKDAGDIRFVEIHEKYTDARLSFEGRIIFSRGEMAMLKLARKAARIEAKAPSVKNGSEKTQRLGIALGYLTIDFGGGYDDSLYCYSMPDLISGQWTYQPEVIETCPNSSELFWGNYRVSKFISATKPEPKVMAA
jgi:hypothetical protein